MHQRKKIAVIAPCFNESQKIGRVCHRVAEVSIVDTLFVVDDGSTDDSAAVAARHGATVLSTPRRQGVGAAIRLGLEHCQNRFDIVVIIAGNDKDEPREIASLVEPITANTADFVQGSRYLPGGKFGGDMPLYRKWATRLHPLLFSFVVRKKVTESTNGFRAMRVELLRDSRIHLRQDWLNSYALEPYLYFKAVTLGYRTTEVPVTKIYPSKKEGNTKMAPIVGWWEILSPLLFLWLRLRK